MYIKLGVVSETGNAPQKRRFVWRTQSTNFIKGEVKTKKRYAPIFFFFFIRLTVSFISIRHFVVLNTILMTYFICCTKNIYHIVFTKNFLIRNYFENLIYNLGLNLYLFINLVKIYKIIKIHFKYLVNV